MHGINLNWALWIFIVSASKSFDLPIAVRIPLSEALAFGSIPILLSKVKFGSLMPRLNFVIGLLLIWLLGSVISDFVNLNYFERGLRGASKPIFIFLWMLFFIGILVKDYRLLLFTVLGSIFASLQNILFPQDFTAEFIAQGGYAATAFGLTPLLKSLFFAVAVWSYPRSKVFSAACLFAMALSMGFLNAPRSAVAVSIMTSALVGYMALSSTGGGIQRFRLSVGRLLVLGVLGLVLLYGIYESYVIFAQNGWLGDYQRDKLALQSKTVFGNSPIGLVIGGRPQIFGAMMALKDHFMLGSGSWTAYLMTNYFYDAMVFVGADSDTLKRLAQGAQAGVGHSILLQIWLENGLLALVALVSTLWIATKVFLQAISKSNLLTPIIILSYVSFFWNFWFSPFDTSARMEIGMFFALHVCAFPQVWQTLDKPLLNNKPRF